MTLKRFIVLSLVLCSPILLIPRVSTSYTSAERIFLWDRSPGTVIAIQDRSDLGSPLVFSGSMTLWEEPVEDGLRSAPAADFEARNISGKTILGFVLDWELFGSWEQQEFPGKQVEDCFFALDVIPPGGLIPFRLPPSSEGVTTPFDTSAPRQEPQAFVYVRYVQFTDGSEFGSKAFGEELFSLRDAIWRQLRTLDRAHRRGGEEAFLEELYDPLEDWGADFMMQKVRKTQEARGTEVALRQVRKMLVLAREHQEELDQED